MNKVTIDNVMALNPCPDYTREVVQSLWNSKEQLSLREILNLNIPIKDRSWVLARLVPTEIVVKWAQHCADKTKEYDGWAAKCAASAAKAAVYWAAYDAYEAASAAHWAADWAASSAAYAAYAADWAATSANKDHNKTLYILLEKLIDMNNQTIDTKQTNNKEDIITKQLSISILLLLIFTISIPLCITLFILFT